MSNSVFDRLGYNFDSDNFEGAEQLSQGALNSLEMRKITMATWQYDQVARGDTARTNYFRNPTANLYISLRSTANNLSRLASNLSLSNVAISANSFVLELDRFKSHTDNISGILATSGRNNIDYTIPQYESAMAIAEQTVTLLYSADNVANSVGALGSFTSLFINKQLTANDTILSADLLSMNSAISYSGLPLLPYSTLGGVAIEAINSHIATANSMVATRRNHDWNFFKKAQQISADMGVVSQFNSMGKMRSNLIYSKIGTDALIANLQAPIIHSSNTGISSSANSADTTSNADSIRAATLSKSNIAFTNYYATASSIQEEVIPDIGTAVGSQQDIVANYINSVALVAQNT
jgi:hypothetical protein